MNPTLPAPRFVRSRRPTPWPIRIFLVIAIAFGVWVDLSTDLNSAGANGDSAADPAQTPLIGLTGEHSVAANIVRTLAARHE